MVRRGVAPTLLVAAGVANLPIVYLLIADGAARVPTLAMALLAVGDAWAAGAILERRRAHLGRFIAVVTLLEGALLYAWFRYVEGAGVPEPAVFWASATAATLFAGLGLAFEARPAVPARA